MDKTKRTIFSRLPEDKDRLHYTQTNSKTLNTRAVKKTQGNLSSTLKQKHDEKEKMARPATFQNSSQSYKKMLEEMELKIRYMKNDIEFKQDQMRKKKTQDDHASSSSNNNSSRNKVSHLQPSAISMKGNRKLLIFSHGVESTKSLEKSVHDKDNANLTTNKISSLAVPHLVMQQNANKVSHHQLLPQESRVVLKIGPQDSQSLRVEENQNDYKTLRWESTSVSTHSRVVIGPQSALNSSANSSAPTSTSIPVDHLPLTQNRRTVIAPLKKEVKNDSRLVMMSKPVSNHSQIQSLNPNVGSNPSTVHESFGKSKYKYETAKSVDIRNDESFGKSKYKYETAKSVDIRNDERSTSHTMSSSDPSIRSSSTLYGHAGHRIIFSRQTSIETRCVKRMTPLKVKTAAKLISKYKLKRLSPTSVSKVAPQFHPYSTSSLHRSQFKEPTTLNYSSSRFKKINLFKLDNRKINTNITNDTQPGVNYKRDQNCDLRKSKSRYSVKYTNSQSCTTSNQATSKLPVLGHNINQHSWISTNLRAKYMKSLAGKKNILAQNGNRQPWAHIDVRTKRLKKIIFTKRHAAIAHSHWKSTRYDTSGLPVNISKFKWLKSQDAQHRHKLCLFDIQRPIACGQWKNSMMSGTSRKLEKSAKLVMIGGVVYRSSPSSLMRQVQTRGKDVKMFHREPIRTKTNPFALRDLKHQSVKLIHLRGVRYHLDARGKKLCRVNGPTANTIRVVDSSLKPIKLSSEKFSDFKKIAAASRALQRSLAFVAAKHKKDNRLRKGKQRNCMFYCRFGKCHRGETCPYAHDPSKVVVCTRFLRGKCDIVNCRFSHDASVHKMPVCLYYLQGQCSRRDCRYLHVNVSHDAPPCKDFLQGYCSLGLKCKNLHSSLCPSFAVFGKCLKGDKCSLLHRHTKKSQIASPSTVPRSQSSLPVSHDSVGKSNIVKFYSTPALSSQHAASLSSSLAAEESNGTSTLPCDKSLPLEAQPAYISLPSLNLSDVSVLNETKKDAKTRSTKERQTKITPEFSHKSSENVECLATVIGERSDGDFTQADNALSCGGVLSNIEETCDGDVVIMEDNQTESHREQSNRDIVTVGNTESHREDKIEPSIRDIVISDDNESHREDKLEPSDRDIATSDNTESHRKGKIEPSDRHIIASAENTKNQSSSVKDEKDLHCEKAAARKESSQLVASNSGVTSIKCKQVTDVDTSGFINFWPSGDPDFINVETSGPSFESECLELSAPQSPQHRETNFKSKAAFSRAALFKGIIPNFLPISSPGSGRSSPGSPRQ